MKTGIELIAEERERQISSEGWTHEHDDEHTDGEIADAAACYAMTEAVRELVDDRETIRDMVWPASWVFKPSPDNRVRELVKAGALIAAEIDRLNRLAVKGK